MTKASEVLKHGHVTEDHGPVNANPAGNMTNKQAL